VPGLKLFGGRSLSDNRPAVRARSRLSLSISMDDRSNAFRTRRFVLIAVALAVSASPVGFAQSRAPTRGLSIADMMKIRHLHDVAISPAGDSVAIVVAEPDFTRNSYRFELLLVDAESGAQRPVDSGTVTQHPSWSPDGAHLAFVRKAAGIALCRFNIQSGRLTDLAAQLPATPSSLKCSPDGRQLAYLARDTTAPTPSATPVDMAVEGAEPVVDRLYLCDVSAGVPTPIAGVTGHVKSFAWSPDSRVIAYARQPSARKVDDGETDLWLADVATGACRPLVARPAGDGQPAWSPDGQRVAFFSNESDSNYFQPYALNIVDVNTAAVQSLAAAVGPQLTLVVGSQPVWSGDGSAIFVTAERGMERQLFRVDVGQCACRQVSQETCVHRSSSWTANAGRLALAIDSPDSPADLYVTDAERFAPRRLTQLNPQLAAKALGQAAPLRWRSAEGVEIEGLLVVPPDRQPGERVPLIVYLHGGPPANFLQGFAPEIASSAPQVGFCPVHILAGRGYAVLCPNPRGSDGYGRAFREAVIGKWGEADLADVLAGVDEAVAIGVADPDRLALTGYCYGAYLSLRALTRTDRFKAAFLGGTFGDLSAVYGQTEVPELFEAYFGGPPWEHRAAYERCSPLRDASAIRTPVFMVHARHDHRVPWSQSKELYSILRRVGTPAELVTYPRGDHTVLESRMHAETMRLAVTWFDRWLKRPTEPRR
jgi:dipeptidyl aminopeptidase/acylaminoacyl peptidase